MPARRSGRQRAAGPPVKAETEPASLASSAPYDVDFTESAFEVYKTLYQKMTDAEARGQNTSAHHTAFRTVEEAIKIIIPRDPVNKRYGLSGPLSKFFRLKKGRHRICWAASSQQRKVCIVFISETLRKEGDKNDPYEIFTKMVLSGKYDDILSDLGLHSPKSASAMASPSIN